MTAGNLTLAAAPRRPALRATLHRLGANPDQAMAGRGGLALESIGGWLRIPRAELALLGRSIEGYVATKVAYVLLGVAPCPRCSVSCCSRRA